MSKIILPDKVFGKQIKGAVDRVLSKQNKETKEVKQPTNMPDLEGFIYIPEVKLYFTDSKILTGLTWPKTQDELKNKKIAMPTPFQFRAFLKYLRDSKDTKYQDLFKEITEVREPWRSCWINAKFEQRQGGLYMISEDVLDKGAYKNIEQKLDDCLMEDKLPGIDLNSWLDSDSKHGLPKSKIKSGNLYYWSPRAGSVARFLAHSGRALLSCCRYPDNSASALGVFACAEGAAPKNS
jgi:hypothetical protein